ncbi:hypothetical protein ACFQ07_05545, partial [Actinomadura adrarensis]
MVSGTFPPPPEERRAAPIEPPVRIENRDETPEPTPDPTARLLDRISEACETRFEKATIRRIDADPPHLLLSHLEDGFVRQYRIGAHVGQVTEADVDAFVRHVHADGTDFGSELVYLGPPPPRSLREDAMRRGIRLRSLTEFQGLLDLSEYVAGQTARLNAGGLYPPPLY